MKLSALVAFLAVTVSSVSAFAPPCASFSCRRAAVSATQVYSSEPESTEEGLDLNLEEMFDMFDAADKDESFDDAIKKVKKED